MQALQTLSSFTDEQIALLKSHYAKGATDTELQLFMGICQRSGLDPFKGQCHYIKRKDRFTFQTSIDGFRGIAAKSGEYAGQVGPHWCGPDGEWREVWLDRTKRPAAARVGVLRRGFAEPIYSVAKWDDFGSNDNLWAKMPEHMLAKVAEAHALRRAFPNELGGLYTSDEMEQAEIRPAARVTITGRSGPVETPVTVVASELEVTVPEGFRYALAECTTPGQVEEVGLLWRPEAEAQGWSKEFDSLTKKRFLDVGGKLVKKQNNANQT